MHLGDGWHRTRVGMAGNTLYILEAGLNDLNPTLQIRFQSSPCRSFLPVSVIHGSAPWTSFRSLLKMQNLNFIGCTHTYMHIYIVTNIKTKMLARSQVIHLHVQFEKQNAGVMNDKHGLRVQVFGLKPSTISCVILGKFLKRSVPYFPYL